MKHKTQTSNSTLPILDKMGKQEKITSLEIAQLAGKQHKNVMRDIREMEPAWEKVCGLKFELTSRMVEMPNGGWRNVPCYALDMFESLFVATKFNDEARARLVMRWAELEQQEQKRIQAELLRHEADANYAREVLQSVGTLTATQIAKEMDMSAMAMNKRLHEYGIIFKQSGEWQLYAKYHGHGLVDKETLLPDGQWRCPRRMRWTEEGHRFLIEVMGKPMVTVHPKQNVIQLTINFDNSNLDSNANININLN